MEYRLLFGKVDKTPILVMEVAYYSEELLADIDKWKDIRQHIIVIAKNWKVTSEGKPEKSYYKIFRDTEEVTVVGSLSVKKYSDAERVKELIHVFGRYNTYSDPLEYRKEVVTVKKRM